MYYFTENNKYNLLEGSVSYNPFKTIRNSFSNHTTPPLSKFSLSGESIMTFSREGRLCSAPIHPQTCQFHSNVSSGFYGQTNATIALTSHMRAGRPALPAVSRTITEPRHDCTLWRQLLNQFKLKKFFLQKNSRCRQWRWRSAAVVTRPDKMWNKVSYCPLRLTSC